jgi:hypothetical protein
MEAIFFPKFYRTTRYHTLEDSGLYIVTAPRIRNPTNIMIYCNNPLMFIYITAVIL